MNKQPVSQDVAAMIVVMAQELRSPDPSARAEFGKRLVEALDRHGYALDRIVAAALRDAPSVATKSPPGRPMGQYNWAGWARFMLLSPLLTQWEHKFIKVVMRRAFPSAAQREKLREILQKVYPAGCGRWGLPKTAPTR